MSAHSYEQILFHWLTYIRIILLPILVLGPAVTLFHFLKLPPLFDQKIVDATFSADLKAGFSHDVRRTLDYKGVLLRSYHVSLRESSYPVHLIFLTHHEYAKNLQDLRQTLAHPKIINLVHEEEHVLIILVATFL